MTDTEQGTPSGPSPAPVWQHRLRSSAPFRAGQAAHRRLLQRWLVRRSELLAPLPAHGSRPHRCVVLAPHPDDETLGCGAYLHRRAAEGVQTTVVVVTDGRHSHRSAVVGPEELAAIRQAESRAACARLGVHEVRFLGLEEGTLDTPAAVASLAAVLDDVLADPAPCEVLLPSAHDGHPDHRALNAAVRARLRRFPATRALEYPIWFWDAASWTRPGSPAWRKGFDVVSGPIRAVGRGRVVRQPLGVHAAAKRAAIAEYRSQTTNLTGEPGWVTFEPRFLAAFGRDDELFFVVGEN